MQFQTSSFYDIYKICNVIKQNEPYVGQALSNIRFSLFVCFFFFLFFFVCLFVGVFVCLLVCLFVCWCVCLFSKAIKSILFADHQNQTYDFKDINNFVQLKTIRYKWYCIPYLDVDL